MLHAPVCTSRRASRGLGCRFVFCVSLVILRLDAAFHRHLLSSKDPFAFVVLDRYLMSEVVEIGEWTAFEVFQLTHREIIMCLNGGRAVSNSCWLLHCTPIKLHGSEKAPSRSLGVAATEFRLILKSYVQTPPFHTSLPVPAYLGAAYGSHALILGFVLFLASA